MANKFISTLTAGLGLASIAVTGLYVPQAHAEEFGNNDIKFDKDTLVEFEFLESHGSYKATFGVVDLNTGTKIPLIKEEKPSDSDDRAVNKASDFLGTPGNAVPQPKNVFLFKANTPYTLYLESRTGSGRVASIVYSNNGKNPKVSQQTMLDKGFDGLSAQGVQVKWNDQVMTGKSSSFDDFNDFIVIAGGAPGCDCATGGLETAPVTPDPEVAPEPAPIRPKPRRKFRRGRG
jgi:hypothetical protein